MKPAHQKLLVAALLVVAAMMLGSVAARVFLGLSHERMLLGIGVALAALVGLAMFMNRITHGVWIKRPTEDERVAVDASLSRARWGYLLGSLALLPVVFVLIRMGFDSGTATSLSVLAGAVTAAVLFARHRRRSA